jgi:plasmid stability protein
MSSLLVRGLDDSIKAKLRIRAAEHGRSMEAEVREILNTTLSKPPEKELNLAESIRRRFEPLGPFKLDLPPREPTREPPSFGG